MRGIFVSLVIAFSAVGSFGAPAKTAPKPLFHKADEIFDIVDSGSKTPVIPIFKDTPMKRALAVAMNSALDLKSASNSQVDVKLQKILFRTKKDPSKAAVFMHISGYEIDFESSIAKSDLRAGNAIQIRIPESNDSYGFFKITSKGELTVKFDGAKNELQIINAAANLDIQNPMSESETEQIKFSGRGLRKP